jgi:hypothetical protein
MLQHCLAVHLPFVHARFSLSAGTAPASAGHVKVPQVGGGVVVWVGAWQQTSVVHLPFAQTVSSGLLENPAGQE